MFSARQHRCAPYLSAVLFSTVDLTTTTKILVPLLCGGSTPSSSSAWHQPLTARLPQGQYGMCLEKISVSSYVTMAAHPDRSGRVFLSSQDGKIWLASIPERGSGGTLRVPHSPFLDLTDRVHYDAAHGLMGVAFHPDFATNGRFFVSYNCDSSASPDCGVGRCWDAGVATINSSRSCRYQLVVAEFSAEGDGANYSKATRANTSQVRRIFSVGLPQPRTSYSYQQHGGQILFRPGNSDEYLYLITGYGDFSKNRGSLLGKVVRFAVGGMSGESRQTSNRGTPTPNLKMGKPEIFSMGLSNPSGCTFDSQRPSYLYCTDVNEQHYERVYLITEGGHNGVFLSKSAISSVINHGRPADGRMPSIVGGLVYRGSADPLLNGRFMYIYASGVWASVESRSNGSYASAQLSNVRCSSSSPLPCRHNGIGISIVGRVLYLGEDNNKDAFVLATGGVFRVVPPGLCGVTPQPSAGEGWVLAVLAWAVLLAVCLVCGSPICGGGAQIGRSFIECFHEIKCCNFYFWGGSDGSARAKKRRARPANNN